MASNLLSLTPRTTQERVVFANGTSALMQAGTSVEPVQLVGRVDDTLAAHFRSARGGDPKAIEDLLRPSAVTPGGKRTPGIYLCLASPRTFRVGEQTVTTDRVRLASSGNSLIQGAVDRAGNWVAAQGNIKIWQGEVYLYLTAI